MNRTRIAAAVVLVGLLAVGGLAYSLWGGSSEAPATLEETVSAVAADDVASGDDGGTVDSLAGTWTVQQVDGTSASFSIDEVLGGGIGEFTAVGTTPGVTGSMEATADTITAASFEVDMTQLTTDDSRRDGAIRNQAIETATFPTASFELAEPIEVGELPGEGESISVTAVGDLTVHGVTNRVEFPLAAQTVGSRIVVAGDLEVSLPDYDIDPPSAPVVASVEDTAIVSIRLVLAQG